MWVPSLASWTGWVLGSVPSIGAKLSSSSQMNGGGLFVAGPRPVDGVGCLIVVPKDLMKFEAVKLFLELSYLLAVCRHAGGHDNSTPL
jgi:hypothetical protein